jgi:hypothetical protein
MVFNSKPSNNGFFVHTGIAEFLQPFADNFPETVGQITKELSDDTPYLQLGQMLLEAIQHKFVEQEHTAQVALHDNQAKLNKSQQEATQLTKVLQEQEAFHKRNQADKDAEIQSLTETIHTQNRILARQQKKLQRLLGAMEQESEA